MYPTISRKGTYGRAQVFCDILAFANGKRSLIEISDAIDVPVRELLTDIAKLLDNGLLKEAEKSQNSYKGEM